jgi:hypothetical protein
VSVNRQWRRKSLNDAKLSAQEALNLIEALEALVDAEEDAADHVARSRGYLHTTLKHLDQMDKENGWNQ